MSVETNLRQAIIDSATELFMKNGYTATSIKQIASAAGCKTSSMYYYFEGGKSDILGAVIQSITFDINQIFGDRTFESLAELLGHYTKAISETMPRMNLRISWLAPEFSKLSEDEMAHIQGQFLNMHEAFASRIQRFVDSEVKAAELAWIIICAYQGYGNLFLTLGMSNRVNHSLADYGDTLVQLLCGE